MSVIQNLVEPHREPGAVRTVVMAVLSGVLFAVIGLGLWGTTLLAGSSEPRLFPYALAAMAAFLVAAPAWLKWGRWPESGTLFRRQAVRLNAVSWRPFLLSLSAGWSMMQAGFALYVAHRTMLAMGGESPIALPHAPLGILLPGLVMAGIVAGVVEEIAFRGFMQTTLEQRFGIVPAILVSGFVWALFHTNHSYFGEEALVWFAIFLAVATMLGTIAHRTNSLLPGIAVHSGFDIAYFVAAGVLQPRIAPIAFVQSIAAPQTLFVFAAIAAMVSVLSWRALFRATRP